MLSIPAGYGALSYRPHAHSLLLPADENGLALSYGPHSHFLLPPIKEYALALVKLHQLTLAQRTDATHVQCTFAL